LALPEFRDDGWLPEGHHPAEWQEVEETFGGGETRTGLTRKLLTFRNELRMLGISGYLVLDGSYISSRATPHDFDVLLVAAPGCQALVNNDPQAARLLDAEYAEKQRGFSFLFVEETSGMLTLIKSVWDISKQGIPKGVVEVAL
jgi:hypothetical protein